MNDKELMQITEIVDKIKLTSVYQAYKRAYCTLLSDQNALALLADYQQVQKAYAANVVANGIDLELKAKAKEQLLTKKVEIHANTTIQNHVVMSRTVEFFMDDLNYEINQMLGNKQKKQCGTHRSKGENEQ